MKYCVFQMMEWQIHASILPTDSGSPKAKSGFFFEPDHLRESVKITSSQFTA
jgi:hypothetical protein